MPQKRPHAVCGAKTRSGKPCQQPQMPNGRCKMHGGKSLVGTAVASYKDGRYSKHMPTRMAGKYTESLNDPDLLSLRSEIAILDAQLAEVLESGNQSESGELWKRLKEALRAYDAASRAKDPEISQAEAFGKMRWLINEGYQDWMARIEARHIIQARVATVTSERSRLEKIEEFTRSKFADALLGAMYNCVEKHVTDRDTLTAIGRELRYLIAVKTGG